MYRKTKRENGNVYFKSKVSLVRNICGDKERIIAYQNDEDDVECVWGGSIYELQHKMKKWAVKAHRENEDNTYEHFYINHIESSFIGYTEIWQCIVGYRGNKEILINEELETFWSDMNITFTAYTEFKAVVKACEWILKNRSK